MEISRANLSTLGVESLAQRVTEMDADILVGDIIDWEGENEDCCLKIRHNPNDGTVTMKVETPDGLKSIRAFPFETQLAAFRLLFEDPDEAPEAITKRIALYRYITPKRGNMYWGYDTCLTKIDEALKADDLQTVKDILDVSNLKYVRDSMETAEKESKQRIKKMQEKWADDRMGKLEKKIDPELERLILQRDFWRCRYCSARIIDKEVKQKLKKKLQKEFDEEVISLRKNKGLAHLRHALVWVRGGGADYVEKHAKASLDDPTNLVTTCQICQDHRGDAPLNEIDVIDPRLFPPIQCEWTGLREALGLRLS